MHSLVLFLSQADVVLLQWLAWFPALYVDWIARSNGISEGMNAANVK